MARQGVLGLRDADEVAALVAPAGHADVEELHGYQQAVASKKRS